MNAREYLERFPTIEARIKLKNKQIAQLHESLLSFSVPTDKEQVSHTKNVDVMSQTITRIFDMEREIDEEVFTLLNLKHEAYKLLDQIPPDSASLLIEHYIKGISINTLAKTKFWSQRHVYRRLAVALELFQSVLDQEHNCTVPSPRS